MSPARLTVAAAALLHCIASTAQGTYASSSNAVLQPVSVIAQLSLPPANQTVVPSPLDLNLIASVFGSSGEVQPDGSVMLSYENRVQTVQVYDEQYGLYTLPADLPELLQTISIIPIPAIALNNKDLQSYIVSNVAADAFTPITLPPTATTIPPTVVTQPSSGQYGVEYTNAPTTYSTSAAYPVGLSPTGRYLGSLKRKLLHYFDNVVSTSSTGAATGHANTVIGYAELAVDPSAVNQFLDAVNDFNVSVLAVHTHWISTTINPLYLHLVAVGQLSNVANSYASLLNTLQSSIVTGTVTAEMLPTLAPQTTLTTQAAGYGAGGQGGSGNVATAVLATFNNITRSDVQKVQSTLGNSRGQFTSNGSSSVSYYHTIFAVPYNVNFYNLSLGASAMLASTATFVGTANDTSAVFGQFAVTAKQIQPTVKALRAGGINVASIVNHYTDIEPQVYFVHYQALSDDLLALAATVRSVLDATGVSSGLRLAASQ